MDKFTASNGVEITDDEYEFGAVWINGARLSSVEMRALREYVKATS